MTSNNSHRTGHKDLFQQSRENYRRLWKIFIPAALLSSILWKLWRILAEPQLISALNLRYVNYRYTGFNGNNLISVLFLFVLQIAVFALVLFWESAFITVTLNLKESGTKTDLNKIFSHWLKLLPAVSLAALLFAILATAGFFILIIPAFVLIFLFQFSPFIAVLTGKRNFEILKASAFLTAGHFPEIFLRSIAVMAVISLVHLLTRKMLLLSIFSQALLMPFGVTYLYLLFKKISARS